MGRPLRLAWARLPSSLRLVGLVRRLRASPVRAQVPRNGSPNGQPLFALVEVPLGLLASYGYTPSPYLLNPIVRRVRPGLQLGETTPRRVTELQHLIPFLEEFYAERRTPYASRLIITPVGAEGSRLSCQGAKMGYILSEPEQESLLQEHQAEMRDFALFVKAKLTA